MYCGDGKKMINRQLIAFVAPVLLITLLFLSSTMIFDYAVMGKPVWGPAGEKMHIGFFLTNVLLDR